jgi:hypothetical protein|tara:strand:+ start:157 stop:807 length:651 start_codon:yes stop_codon:yes gene_type:complete
MLHKKIAWERWDEDVIEQEIAEDFYSGQTDEDDEDGVMQDAIMFLDKIPSLVTTPMGMYQLHDKMNIMNQFDCWMGYTNFDITESVKDIIENTEGVELLNIMTRYRFFIGVGKLFDFSDVRVEIERSISGDSYSDDDDIDDIDDVYDLISIEETEETVDMIRDSISTDRYWAIFVCKSGEILYTSTNKDNDETYIETLERYKKRKNNNGGLIYQNE